MKHPPDSPEAHELKICKEKSFAFDRVQPHQIEALKAVSRGFYYKISDMAAQNGFASPKPFDNIWMVKAKGYVVILFYIPRKMKLVYKTHINDWLNIVSGWKRKSIRREELANCLGVEEINLNLKC